MNPAEHLQTEVVHELDPEVWRAWKQRGARQDHRAAAGWIVAVKSLCLVALFATALFWNYVAAYAGILKPLVTVGAIVVALQAVSTRRYGFAAVFAFLAILFNPFRAFFGMSTLWDFSIVTAAVIPFAASLVWLKSRLLGSAS